MAPSDTARDTTDDAAQAQLRALRALRAMGRSGRLAAGMRFSRSMISRSRAALRARHPDADETRLKLLWIEQSYGAELAEAVAEQMRKAGRMNMTNSS